MKSKVPSPTPTVKVAGMPKGAPAKKAPNAGDNKPKTNPLGVSKPAPAKKSAKTPAGAPKTPYGTNGGK